MSNYRVLVKVCDIHTINKAKKEMRKLFMYWYKWSLRYVIKEIKGLGQYICIYSTYNTLYINLYKYIV